jgi:hypothetical protein
VSRWHLVSLNHPCCAKDMKELMVHGVAERSIVISTSPAVR